MTLDDFEFMRFRINRQEVDLVSDVLLTDVGQRVDRDLALFKNKAARSRTPP